MRSMSGQRVIIIGGGATGALLASHLLRDPAQDLQVTIVEKTPATGLGVAYSTVNPHHLLNVRVSNMSAFPDQPGHFWEWVIANKKNEVEGCEGSFCFVPRAIYGSYLGSLLAAYRTQGREKLRVLRGEAVALRLVPSGVAVTLGDGMVVSGDMCIVATGNEAPAARYARSVSPWVEPAKAGIPLDRPVLIVGSGLTMVDYVLSLLQARHSGQILALSRRGLLPHVHRDVPATRIDAADVPFGGEVSRVMRWLRTLAERDIAAGRDWRSAFDGLRPHVQEIWRRWPDPAKRRFLRHARAWWDVHRHRMAPDVERLLRNSIASGQLKVVAGKVVAVEPDDYGVTVTYRGRGAAAAEKFRAANVVECVGISVNPRDSTNPLLRSLLEQGLARPDPIGIGIDVADDCAVIDRNGVPSRRLLAAGPLTRGRLWEIVSIPDIRVQCAQIAEWIGRRSWSAAE
jgi:uncharacterized NAD(P)/FAD-binding protein YdhS